MRIVGLTLSLFATLAVLQPNGARAEPLPIESAFRLSDQTTLFYRQWAPDNPKIVVLGVHGFNDHSKAFAPLARALLAHHRAVVYAYDQRGFGANPRPGVWAGENRLVDDLREVAQQVRQRHPTLPLIVVGESMGGAVVLRASTERPGLTADKIILKAPAIWGAEAMPWYQRASLQWFNAIAPDFTFTGRGIQSLGIRPTDDPVVSRELSLDPLFIKETRVSSLYGVTQLMGQALNHPIEFPTPTLVLYGLKDKIIPPEPTCYWLTRLVAVASEASANLQWIVYPNGWHMLTRQREAKRVIQDISAWIGGEASAQEMTPMLELDEARAVVCR
ncbi:MAG: hypothetical protein RLY67_836 [Pseudomonadota bacterium]